MLLIIQLIGVLIGLAGFTSSFFRLKNRRIKFGMFVLWSILWSGIIFFSIVPSLSETLANVFGISRGTDLLMYIGVLILFYLLFRLYLRIEELNRSFTKVVKTIAIQNGHSKKKG